MNWRLIAWFAGVLLTLGGMKFVWVFLKNALSRETMEDLIDNMNSTISGAAKKTTAKLKEKAERRKQAKENKPIVTIR